MSLETLGDDKLLNNGSGLSGDRNRELVLLERFIRRQMFYSWMRLRLL